jgi:hypothetical protein
MYAVCIAGRGWLSRALISNRVTLRQAGTLAVSPCVQYARLPEVPGSANRVSLVPYISSLIGTQNRKCPGAPAPGKDSAFLPLSGRAGDSCFGRLNGQSSEAITHETAHAAIWAFLLKRSLLLCMSSEWARGAIASEHT